LPSIRNRRRAGKAALPPLALDLRLGTRGRRPASTTAPPPPAPGRGTTERPYRGRSESRS
jgi:hypothetical protein